ncbi:Protein of unknown function DUF2179 [Syntrophobotulus glycolicus DSM 8271]|uniref:DUF2179 domain-containing protein n=1 Tax=Syntrophobotulus glycolicus (strain DSM 8271 / FlGlyR) TaxID=645991 RepID=F0T229_SYNGF|nr:YitT family protein [Syntrophobotulus glycolicus]ADY56373.1 Protein of unknown function DUF2179 [Syntrophobotulus glycolicus DSM 8271]
MTILLKVWKVFKQSLGILIGAVIVATSINIFIISNKIADGGITGIAIILHYLFRWDTGLAIFIINIPLFMLGYKIIGRRMLLNSILGVTALSVSLKFTSQLPAVTDNQLLASIFGGLVTGIGMGIIFRFHGSLGGTDILALILTKRISFSVGQILLGMDALILLCAAIIFEPEMGMFAMIYAYTAARVIDLVQVGLDYSKSVMVITDKPEQIAEDIILNLERGVTYFQAEGAYSKQDKKVVYSIVNRTQLSQLKDIIHQHDPQAFVAIGEVAEVVGEGFSAWKGH